MSTQNIEHLIRARLTIDEQIDQLNAEREQINHAILDALPEGGQVGETKVTVTTPRRLDTRALAAAYPVAGHPALYKATLDTKAVRKHIAEVVLDGFMVDGKPSVRLS